MYDPAHFNDRLLLGLKGTMSEAELHILKSRLQGGILNKARRGELEMPLPIGLVYDGDGRVVLDPDRQIQDTRAAAVRDLPRDRLGLRGGAPPARAERAVPAAHPPRHRQGRVAVGCARPLAGDADPAQPALRRRVRLRAHAHRLQRRSSSRCSCAVRQRGLAGADP